MANVQVENGALVIADELQLAIMRFEFSALERRVLDAIMRYTYLAGKSKAKIEAEDIRLMIEGRARVRTDRIAEVLGKLSLQKVITYQFLNGAPIIGIQKDYEAWVDKVSSPLQENIYINNYSRSGADKMSTPALLVSYSQEKSGFRHQTTAWRLEHSWAGKLLRKVLALTNDADLARLLIQDYIDENEWMRKNVQRQFAYMFSRFDQWYSQIPRKPREIRENEEALGRRYRYNVKNKQWEMVPPSPKSGG